MKKLMKKIILSICLVFYTTSAFAYIDPGTVSIILQGLIGALAAIIVTLKIYWIKILKFLGVQNKIKDGEDEKKDKNNINTNKK